MLAALKLNALTPLTNIKQAALVEKNLYYQRENPEKVQTILNLSSWYYDHYYDSKATAQKSLYFANEALSLSKKINYPEGIAESYLKLAIILQQAKEYLKAKSFAKKAVINFKALNLQDQLGESWVMYWSASFLTGTSYQDRIPLLQNAAIAFHKSGNKQREADCHKEMGDLYHLLGKSSDAIISLRKALSLYDKSNFQRLYGVYDLMGTVYLSLGDHKTAIAYGLKAARLAEMLDDDTVYLCTVYNRVGVSYFEFQDYENAQKYFLRSLNIAIKNKTIPSIRQLTYNYSNVLIRENKPQAALKFLNEMKSKHPEIFETEATALECQYIQIYIVLHEYSKAQQYEKRVQKKLKKLKEYSDIMTAYATLTKLSLHLKNYPDASQYSCTYDSMAKKLKNNIYYSTSSFLKYAIDSAQGNCSSAMNNYQDYIRYSRNLYDEKRTKQISQMTVLYETEQKNKNIIELKNNSIIQDNKLRHASFLNNLMLICTLSLLAIATLLYVVYRLKQRTNKILSAQQEEINNKNKTLENLVTEKEWLLKEIHHRVKNNLHMVVGLLASQVEFLKNEEAVQAINNSQNRIQSMSLIHQKLYQSENLSMLNMPSYIHELTDYLKDSLDIRKSIRFVFDIDNFDLPLSHSVPVGLIFNEAITNSIKYAFPNQEEGKINISLKANEEHQFTLIIHDNGIGLPPDFDPYDSPSLGIKLMYGLAADINGKFIITNNKGTKVNLTFIINETTID